jgi:hypothetical protein
MNRTWPDKERMDWLSTAFEKSNEVYPWLLSLAGKGYNLREMIDLEMRRPRPAAPDVTPGLAEQTVDKK